MFLCLERKDIVHIKYSTFIATRIFLRSAILLYFGATFIEGNKDIPFCHKLWAELGKDIKDHREQCLDENPQFGAQCCPEDEISNYFESRRISHRQICFYEGPFPEPYLLVKSKTKVAVVDLTSDYSTPIMEGQNQSTKFRSWEIDPMERKMYFENFRKVYKSNFDGSDKQLVSNDTENSHISLFVLDWIGKQLFYVKSHPRNRIIRSTLKFKVVITHLINDKNISSLAVDSNAGWLFYGSEYSLSRINFGGTENQEFKVNMSNFSITIDLGTKRVYLVGVCIHENIIMSMDYDGRNEERVKAGDRINAMAVFGGILYWQKHNTNVVDVINAMTMEVNRTISLPKQWSILNDLRVIDTLHQRRIGECPSTLCGKNEYCCNINSSYSCNCHAGFSRYGPSCKAPKTDLIFVLDRSGSIRKGEYDMMRKFVSKIAKELRVGETNDDGEIIGQVGIVTFSELGEKRITLAESQDKNKFYDVVNKMPGPGGRTKTHRGLAIADEELAVKEAGYREDDPEVKKVIMVITNGKQTRESPRKGYKYVGEAVEPFFKRNMDVFAIGVGLRRKDATKQIHDMVKVPGNAIFPGSYSDLLNRVESIFKKFSQETDICERAGKVVDKNNSVVDPEQANKNVTE